MKMKLRKYNSQRISEINFRTKVIYTLCFLFLVTSMSSCNLWRKGSVIKGADANFKRHTHTATAKAPRNNYNKPVN